MASPGNDIDNSIAMVQFARRNSRLLLSFDRPNSISYPDPTEEINNNIIPIEPHVYSILLNGTKPDILSLLETNPDDINSCILHVLAAAGRATLIADILPDLSEDAVMARNARGDYAVHVAAKTGQMESLEALLQRLRELLGCKNYEGDTPLHIALENYDEEMAEYLVGEYGEACVVLNDIKVCPLYLAVKKGYWKVVNKMLSAMKEREVGPGDGLLGGKSVVHAAIQAKNLDILGAILENHGSLIESFNEEGRTPLSYAALQGYKKAVRCLLKKYPQYAFKCDKDGSFPIHSAARGGHIKVLKELHNTKRLLNREGQNILHVAAGSGKSKVVSYILKLKELERLINQKDENGDTALHLATKGFHPRVVYILTREKRVKRELQNKDGLTALDVAEIHAGWSPTFEARLTWMALRYVDAPRSSQSTRKSYIHKASLTMEGPSFSKLNKKENDRKELSSYKDRIDTHLLVATLVATVTFAAGFTLPGGYYQDGENIGMAVLADKCAFKAFVVCNTAAMYSSILAVVTLIWAHMGDLKLVLVSLRFALPLLGFALAMMSLAFMTGVFIVLENTVWLSYVVLGMGSIFLAVVLVFFIPLYNPSYIRNPVVRFFFSGTFLLLLLVCEKGKIEYAY